MRRLLSGAISVLICLATAASMLGFAYPRKVRLLHPDFADELVYAELDNQPVDIERLTDLEISSGSALRIYLFGDGGKSLFYDQDHVAIPTADVTMSRMRAAGIEAVVESLQEGTVEVTATLSYSNAGQPLPSAAPYIEIVFRGDLSSAEDNGFALQCALAVNGTVQEQTVLQVAGTIYMEERSVSAGDIFVDIRKGRVVIAEDDISLVALQLDHNVLLYTPVRSGERYFGTVRQQLSPDNAPVDDVVLSYTLDTTNLDSEYVQVRIAVREQLYAYDGDGNYLGTTAELLPNVDRYYLSRSLIV